MPRDRHPHAPDSEKLTLNLGYVDLGQVDLLVREGLYANRADFLRTAVRNQLERHRDVTGPSLVRRGLQLGLSHYGRLELERAVASGERLDIRALGLVSIAADVPPALADAAIASITVLGGLHASAAVRAILADRLGAL